MSNHSLLITAGIGLLINGLSFWKWDLILLGNVRAFPFSSKESVVIWCLLFGVVFLFGGVALGIKKMRQSN
jgi:hypothetical protein